jgi:hypothetical protein
MLLLRNLLVGSCILAGLSFTVRANTIHMSIDSGDPPPCSSPVTPISTGINEVAANGDCPTEVFDFVNNFTQIINGFTFSTTVLTGLNPASFSCSSGYFESCLPDYNATTGALEYSYSGIITPASFINCCSDGGPNGDEGIAPGAVFNVTLSGWTVANGLYSNDMEGTPGGPQPFINTVSIVPEPTTLASLLLGFLLLSIGLGIRNLRHLASRTIGGWRTAKFAMALLVGAVACSASPIFYLVNQTVGTDGGGVTGSIETDGTIGTILGTDILDWNLLVSDGSTTFGIQGGPLDPDPNSALLYAGDITATPTELLFNFSATNGGTALFEANSVGSNNAFWCVADTTEHCAGSGSGESLQTTADVIQFTSVSGNQVIAANPEPSTIAFAVAGLLGIFLIRRRLAKKSA